MPKFILSPEAQKRLIEIGEYTLEQFGPRQKQTYLKLLRDQMRVVAKNPKKGKERSDIKAGYYSISAGKHNIYYRVRDTHIEIIDVLHHAMEPRLHL